MSFFDDALIKPLPSSVMTEGDEEDEIFGLDDETSEEGCKSEGCNKEGCNSEGCNSEGCSSEGSDEDLVSKAVGVVSGEDDEDEEDIDDLSDEEIDQLDKNLSGDTSLADREQQVTLTPEEERDADDIMALAATASLVNSELNTEEKREFAESYTDRAIACNEGFMTEADFDALEESYGETLTEAYNQKMVIRLDAASKKKQLHAIAVNASAAAHNDPDWIKYKKICALKKQYREKLETRYAAEATKRERIYWQRLQHSKAKPLAKIAKDNA